MTLRAVNAPARLDAGTLEQPLEAITWMDGSTLSGVQPFSLEMFEMHEALQEPGATAAAHLDLLRLCVPDGATWTKPDGTSGVVDEPWRRRLPGPRVFLVFEHAQYRLRQMVAAVEDARKNGHAGAAADDSAPPPPSSPTMSSSSPSLASPAPSDSRGSSPRNGRSTSSSTSSIASKKSNASRGSTPAVATSGPSVSS